LFCIIYVFEPCEVEENVEEKFIRAINFITDGDTNSSSIVDVAESLLASISIVEVIAYSNDL
jgi:hypothetical protein